MSIKKEFFNSPVDVSNNNESIDVHTLIKNEVCQAESSKDTVSDHGRKRDIADSIIFIEQTQCSQLLSIDYCHRRPQANVTHVYNPLNYASIPHSKFVKQFGNSKRKILFLGMNPGPYGMAQTGVPFGDITFVQDWLGISGHVSKPVKEHPKRPIEGFMCTRSEVSGTRFWNLIKILSFGDPKVFFENCYIHNYCPLCFMSVTGKNITPPMFKASVRREFHDICDRSLLQIIELLQIEVVIAVGKYVEGRSKDILKDFNKWTVTVFSIMHPSPINPAANKRNWQEHAIEKLREENVLDIIRNNLPELV